MSKAKKLKVTREEYTPTTVKDLIFHAIRPYKRGITLFFVLTFVGVFAWVASTYVTSLLINELSEDLAVDARIWQLVVAFSLLRLFDEFFWRTGDYVMRNIKPYMVERLRATLYKSVTQRSHAYFVNASSGRIAHWINQSVSTFDAFVDITIWTVWARVMSMILATGFLFTVHWSLALLFISWLVALFMYNSRRGKVFAKLVEKQSNEQSKASSLVVDSIGNNLALRVFNARSHELKLLDDQQRKIIVSWRTSWLHNLKTNFFKGFSANVASIAALILALYLLSHGLIGLGGVVLFMAYFSDASNSLWQLAWSLDTYYRQFGTLQNALDGLQGEDEPRSAALRKGTTLPDAVSLSIDTVSFAYADQKEEEILRAVDLKVDAGTKIGLVGHSGAGKTTLIGLLLGFFEPTKGAIRVNGENSTDKGPAYLRALSSFVPQDTQLFNRTLRENIAYGSPGASEADLWHALDKAQAREFVEKLPKGLETLIGERGVKLSGGQRQRIAIARAILRDSPLLLLDEATSALDSVSEQAIQKALHELMKGRTALVIAHRLSTLKHLDTIVVLEKGRVVEQGTHSELVKLGGVYADLWKRQKDGFIAE